ncbi:MAG: GFA family protein [Zhongshania sp.]|uniref:GFA family protein n=1 Tax=Zhongshania sp. TaxID=1971902 RepID=UPI00263244CD|nr:GFA family protein [Zhongshania sp.]MDF1693252.1 GFA family protein [Zhongshania sp.]
MSDIKYKGQCACGDFTYSCEGEPASVMACHCRDCQYASGSAFATVAFFPAANCAMTGPSKVYTVKGEAGLTVKRHFCGNCGTPLYSMLAEMPEMLFIKVGTLEDPNLATLQGHMWCASKLSWLKLDDGLVQLPGNPPLA